MKNTQQFIHESLQDCSSVKDILEALSSGLAKGRVVLEDDDGSIALEPKGLLRVKLSADQSQERNRINLRIIWEDEPKILKKKDLKVSSEK